MVCFCIKDQKVCLQCTKYKKICLVLKCRYHVTNYKRMCLERQKGAFASKVRQVKVVCFFVELILYIPVNNFTVIPGGFPGLNQY